MNREGRLQRAAASPRPDGALIEACAGRGDFVDCFAVDIGGTAAIADLIDAFFGSRAFQPERWLLKIALGKPTAPEALAALASGESGGYAAWTVEARRAAEILLCDFLGVTRCWLMVEPRLAGADAKTRLYFGTAFARRETKGARTESPPLMFSVLRPLHPPYARLLLNSAAARLKRRNGEPGAHVRAG